MTAIRKSLSRPLVSLKTIVHRALRIENPGLLTAPVAESVFDRREWLVVNSWGASWNTYFFVNYL